MNEKEQKAIKDFLKNDFWKAFYEKAPSDVCKEYIAYNFCLSEYPYERKYRDKMNTLEDRFGVEDYRHLMKLAVGKPPYARYAKRVAEMEQNADSML